MKPKIILLLYTALIFTIILLAYLRALPTELKPFPNFDSVGHFILYGTWGYFCGKAFPKPVFVTGKIMVPLGIAVLIPVVVTEESLQVFSAARTFSFSDLACDLLGILVACLIWNKEQALQKKTLI